ncbi:MAG: hypothetical protein Q8L85_03605 [Alphaproteobacteria bacterium]|nr:hypothetical protein [Alphaproteobacteria bacterium]
MKKLALIAFAIFINISLLHAGREDDIMKRLFQLNAEILRCADYYKVEEKYKRFEQLTDEATQSRYTIVSKIAINMNVYLLIHLNDLRNVFGNQDNSLVYNNPINSNITSRSNSNSLKHKDTAKIDKKEQYKQLKAAYEYACKAWDNEYKAWEDEIKAWDNLRAQSSYSLIIDKPSSYDKPSRYDRPSSYDAPSSYENAENYMKKLEKWRVEREKSKAKREVFVAKRKVYMNKVK